jgi:hypothetical protein
VGSIAPARGETHEALSMSGWTLAALSEHAERVEHVSRRAVGVAGELFKHRGHPIVGTA